MADETIESRLESLEKQVSIFTEKMMEKEKEIQELKDIEEIKKLQAAYAYYLENCMGQDVIDCFSNDPGVSGTFVEGTYKGIYKRGWYLEDLYTCISNALCVPAFKTENNS